MRWLLPALLVLAQIAYPLASGQARDILVPATVVLGFAASLGHAVGTRGLRVGVALIATTTLGGLAVEAVGLSTGYPFGIYEYEQSLGPRLLGVPVVVPLAWTWMAWPAWLAAAHLTRRTLTPITTATRIAIAAVGLAAWDLFLDPQMVAAGYWRWAGPDLTLPGVDAVPVSNYLSWLAVSLLMMAGLAATGGPQLEPAQRAVDAPMLALYLWTYASSVLAHAAFLHLPASALWGGLAMGAVAVPLAVRLARR